MTPLIAGLGLLTLGALAAVLWPLVRPPAAAADDRAAGDLAVYRDQLAEVERDLGRGLIRPEEAAAARLEIERRLLRVAPGLAADPAALPVATRGGQAALVAAVLLLPAVTGTLYLGLGAPTLPDRPLASRGDEGGAAPAAAPGTAAPEISAMVARLETRLQSQPDDLDGWLMLGRSRGVLGDSAGAVDALRTAQRLAPEDPRVLGGLGEALVGASGGTVTPEAKGLLEKLLQVGPGGDPRAPYYLGLAAAQAGDHAGALSRWRDLLAASPADAPWRSRVEEVMREVAREAGQDPDAVLASIPKPPAAPAPPPAAPAAPGPLAARPAGPTAGSGPGPTPEQVAAAGQMPPGEQQAFIRSMVDRLDARLADNPGDVEGWRRLAQARMVLGERDRAREAYEKGLAANPNDAGLLKAHAALLLGPARPDTGLPDVGEGARALFERAAAAAPDDPEPRWYLGISALQQGRKDETREHWSRVLALLAPNHPEYASVKQRLDSLGG